MSLYSVALVLSSHSSSYDGNDWETLLEGQNLDGIEEIGKIPRTIGLGHDVVLQVPWDLGLPEEDQALRLVKQKGNHGRRASDRQPWPHSQTVVASVCAHGAVCGSHCQSHPGPQTR